MPSLTSRKAAAPPPQDKPKAQAPAHTPKREAKLSFKDQHRLKEVEAALPRLEAEIADLEKQLGDPDLFSADPKKFEQLTGRLNKARADLDKAEEDWLEIEALKEEIAAKG